jgi:predicted Rossmann-fold nucleotide-binding protein
MTNVRGDHPHPDPQRASCDHGTEYWRELIPFIDKMIQPGKIAASDTELIHVTDSVEDANRAHSP